MASPSASLVLFAIALQAATPSPPTPSPQVQAGDGDAIVVTGHRRVPGAFKPPPRCVRRPGDPADAVPVSVHRGGQSVIAPNKAGVLTLQNDRDPVLGPLVWQRAGNAIGQYVFRAPGDGTPLCIGAAMNDPSGWGQLRRIVPVTRGMTDRYLHFSALMAARDAREIRLWLAAGGMGGRVFGGDTHTAPLKGTFGWQPVDLVIGPVPPGADHVSYGFLLWGRGDVWVTDATLTVETREQVQGMPVVPVAFGTNWDGYAVMRTD